MTEPSAAASSASSATTPSTAAGSSQQSPSAGISAAGSAETPATATAGTAHLNARSVTWVKTFCNGFSDVAKYASPDTKGMGKQATINAIVQAYQNISDSAGNTAVKLGGIPAPTFAGGTKLAAGLHTWFTDISDVYGSGATTIKHGNYDTPDDLKAAIDKVESHAGAANTKLSNSVGKVKPSIANAMLAIPACATFAASVGR